MATSVRMIRWLAWALAILAIVNAVITLGFALNIGAPPPPAENADLVDRLLAFRADDVRIFGVTVLQSLAGLGVFLVAALLGLALRRWAPDTVARDALVLLFVVGGVLGVAANLVNIGVNNAATFGYCDCGYKTEEVIAQNYALVVGWTAVNWLTMGALTFVALGTALAGRLLNLTPAWRLVSYTIALLALFAVALRLVAGFVFIEVVDPFQLADIMVAIAAGILVPIWAILLARSLAPPEPVEGGAA